MTVGSAAASAGVVSLAVVSVAVSVAAVSVLAPSLAATCSVPATSGSVVTAKAVPSVDSTDAIFIASGAAAGAAG